MCILSNKIMFAVLVSLLRPMRCSGGKNCPTGRHTARSNFQTSAKAVKGSVGLCMRCSAAAVATQAARKEWHGSGDEAVACALPCLPSF